MTDQLTHIWLVSHDMGDGEIANTAWTTEDKARAHVEKLKAALKDAGGDPVGDWEEFDDGPAVTWEREDGDGAIILTSLNVDEMQS